MTRRRAVLFLLALGLSGCSFRNLSCGLPPAPADAPQNAGPLGLPASSGGGGTVTKIAFLGDSLTAGLGLLSQQSFPSLIQEKFAADGFPEIEVINAGLSGDTTAGGLRRVTQLLEPDVRILVVALGGNDALRGLSVSETYNNLAEIIRTAQAHGVGVMLCGMEAPTNLGEDYRTAFKDVYLRLLREHQREIVYVPFLLEGVAGNPALNQADGIHPTAEGAAIIADALFPKLRTMVESIGGGG